MPHSVIWLAFKWMGRVGGVNGGGGTAFDESRKKTLDRVTRHQTDYVEQYR